MIEPPRVTRGQAHLQTTFGESHTVWDSEHNRTRVSGDGHNGEVAQLSGPPLDDKFISSIFDEKLQHLASPSSYDRSRLMGDGWQVSTLDMNGRGQWECLGLRHTDGQPYGQGWCQTVLITSPQADRYSQSRISVATVLDSGYGGSHTMTVPYDPETGELKYGELTEDFSFGKDLEWITVDGQRVDNQASY